MNQILVAVICLTSIAPLKAADGPAMAQLKTLMPVPGTVISADEDPATLSPSMAEGSSAECIKIENAPDLPFSAALRVRVGKAYTPSYQIQVFGSKSKTGVRKGDMVVMSCWLRAPEVTNDNIGQVSMRLQMNQEPWSAPTEVNTGCNGKWKQVFSCAVSDQDFETGALSATFHLGMQQQVIDIAGVTALNLGPNVDLSKMPRTPIIWPGMADDAPWRAEAQRRIERYRMADVAVRVVDSAGKPLAGVPVHLKQQRSAFTIGSFVQFANPTRLLTASPDGDRTRDIFNRLFNRATCPIYWADWGWPNRKDEFLAIGSWLRERDMTVRGHVMVYPGFNFMPSEVVRLKSDPPKLRERIRQQVREVSEATKKLGFREYDVTNELRDCVDLHQLFGREVVAEWYAEARRILPDAKLALNENTILTNGGVTQANQDLYLDWYRYLKSKGQAPDVMGFQGHFGENFTPVETVWAILDRFSRETDAELQITEFDINTLNEAAQAAYTRDFMTACFAHPRITGFTMWGFWEGDHWLPKAAAWRKDWSIKPNGKVLEELLTKTWWTDVKTITDTNGTAVIKAFLGRHAVTATISGHEKSTTINLEHAGKPIKVELKP